MVRVLGRQPVRPGRRPHAHARPAGAGVRRRPTRTLSRRAAAPASGDTRPLSDLRRRADGARSAATRPRSTRSSAPARARRPAAVARRPARAARSPPPAPTGAPAGRCSPSARRCTLRPGESVTLRYAYGMAHPAQIAALVAQVPRRRAIRSRTSERALGGVAARRPTSAPADAGSRASSQWDAYLLRSASVYEEACGAPHDHPGRLLPVHARRQTSARASWLHYLLPMIYAEPALAREILRYSVARAAARRAARSRTGPGRCARASTSAPPNDLDFWLLLAAAEYGLGTRDTRSSTSGCRSADTRHERERVGAPQDGVPPPGDAARPARRLHHGHDRRLVRFLDQLPADARVDAGHARSSPTPTRGSPSSPTCAATRASPRRCARGATELRDVVRREWTGRGWYSRGYARRRPDRHWRDLRRAAAVGDPRRRADRAAGDARSSPTSAAS